MNEYHLIYTAKSGKVISEMRKFSSLTICEGWLRSIGATRWEIGIANSDREQNDWRDGHPLDFGDR